MWSSKERKKTGHPGAHISEGRVEEIERKLGISKWRVGGGALYGNFVANFWKGWRNKKREKEGNWRSKKEEGAIL